MVAFFSLLGIALGVATLIIVLSVMNGFRTELLSKIIGINGHVFVSPIDKLFTDYADLSERLSKVAGVRPRSLWWRGRPSPPRPMVAPAAACWCGHPGEDLAKVGAIADSIKGGSLEGFDDGSGVAIGRRLAESLGVQAGDQINLLTPKGASTPFGTAPRTKGYTIRGDLRDRHDGVRFDLRVHAARRNPRPSSTGTPMSA